MDGSRPHSSSESASFDDDDGFAELDPDALDRELDSASGASAAPSFAPEVPAPEASSFMPGPPDNPSFSPGPTSAPSATGFDFQQLRADARKWPTGAAADRSQIQLDPGEVQRIAGYGDAPSAIYLAPLYAFRVFSQQRKLRQQMMAAARTLEEVERERDELLALMVRSARSLIAAHRQLKSALAPLSELESLREQRSQELEGTNQAYAEQRRQLQAEREAHDGDLAQRQSRLEAAKAAADRANESVQRGEAKLKRFHIDMRATAQAGQQAAGPSAPPGTVPPEYAAKIQALQAQAEAAQAELQALQESAAPARDALDVARRELALAQRRGADLDARKSALDAQFNQQIAARSQDVVAAETEERRLLAEIGRAVLAAKGSIPVDEGTLHAIAEADRKVAQHTTAHEKLVRALESYDQSTAKRGLFIVVGGGATLLLLLLVLALR